MTSAWEFSGASAGVGDGVTLVEGSSFCVSDTAGRMSTGAAQGLFYLDTRIVGSWQLLVGGAEVEPLAAFVREPHHATFVGRGKRRVDGVESTLMVRRERYVGSGMREDIVLRNMAAEPAAVTVEIKVDSDFADVFAVKEGRAWPDAAREHRPSDGELEIESTVPGVDRGVRVVGAGGIAAPGALVFRDVLPSAGEWRVSVEVLPIVAGTETPAAYPLSQPIEQAAPAVRLQEWLGTTPVVSSADQDLLTSLSRSEQDLGSLRIYDPAHPEHAAVAAGAPWFMALFGRDSLLTAHMALPLSQDLALGTLRALARYQGTDDNHVTEEQPGRILHEMRFGTEASDALGGGKAYYGTADASPLFVMLLGELSSWGLPDDALHDLLPHADRALQWIESYGDRDGDGFVEYQRLSDTGLRNQGWKDSWDGVNFADGRIAEPAIALCEVQGYVYAAYRARAQLARRLGDAETAADYTKRAASLKAAFNEQYWLPDRGWFAVALDREKRPVDALTSNIGHCLWTGIVDEDKAAAVADHLVSPEMFSGWGVRTLAAGMGAFNPISYHNGSIWPHDNALVAAGLMRYGFVASAQRVAEGILAAATCFGGRLPELFAGLERDDFPTPISYPAACVPQAWASAAPLLLVRSLLRFDPSLPDGKVYLDPVLPESVPWLDVRNLPLGGSRLALSVTPSGVEVDGLPAGVQLIRAPRPLDGGADESA